MTRQHWRIIISIDYTVQGIRPGYRAVIFGRAAAEIDQAGREIIRLTNLALNLLTEAAGVNSFPFACARARSALLAGKKRARASILLLPRCRDVVRERREHGISTGAARRSP